MDTSSPNTENKLQGLLQEYMAQNPDGERILADELRTARGTISRWTRGHSRPARIIENRVINILREKLDPANKDNSGG